MRRGSRFKLQLRILQDNQMPRVSSIYNFPRDQQEDRILPLAGVNTEKVIFGLAVWIKSALRRGASETGWGVFFARPTLRSTVLAA